ncbi:hypothetical protein ABIF66_001642 [Bradyrhizobium japonicum]
MRPKKITNLSAKVKKRMVHIESMTLVQIQCVMMDCMFERAAGKAPTPHSYRDMNLAGRA